MHLGLDDDAGTRFDQLTINTGSAAPGKMVARESPS
jgi:hypothetical protein